MKTGRPGTGAGNEAASAPGRGAPETTGWGRAWLLLSLALGVHVVDEAVHDFLAVYNPTIVAVRAELPWLPLPTFTFAGWLVGLAVAVAVLLLLARPALRGARWLRPLALPYAILMLANGLGHLLGSMALGRALPGVISAPLLVAASSYLLVAWRRDA